MSYPDEIVLEDPHQLSLDFIKTIHEIVEMDDYGSPTEESVDVVCQLLQLERPFVEEVYWVLLGGSPSFGLSSTVNDMILKDYLYRLKVEDCAKIEENRHRGNDNDLALELGLSVLSIQCIRDAIQSNEVSDFLSPDNTEVIELYKAQKEVALFRLGPQKNREATSNGIPAKQVPLVQKKNRFAYKSIVPASLGLVLTMCLIYHVGSWQEDEFQKSVSSQGQNWVPFLLDQEEFHWSKL
jgi:hypothetical protein